MTSGAAAPKSYSTRFLALIALILVVIAAYTAAWFYFASKIEDKAQTAIARINDRGPRAHCEDLSITGYPFRIGVSCRTVFFEDVKQSVSFRSGALSSAAYVYAPSQALAELHGPASLLIPHIPPLDLTWEHLAVSAHFNYPQPDRISIVGKSIQIAPDEDTQPLTSMDEGSFHARILGNDLQTAFNFANLALLDDDLPNLPPLEGRAMVYVTNGEDMMTKHNFNLRGRSGRVEELVVGVVGDTSGVSMSGPISVDDDGFISAKLSIQISNPVGMSKLMGQLFPDMADHFRSAVGMLTALGNRPLDLNIDRGRISLGIIPIGRIGPI